MKRITINNIPEQSYSTKESLRAVRTNIQFCGTGFKVILITSVTPDEGKSTVAFEIASSFAELGKKVLLLDTDVRKSVLVNRHKATTPDGSKINGLTHYLSGQIGINDAFYQTNIENLCIMYAGQSVPNATEILAGAAFSSMIKAFREHFDYVFIDTAPITAAIDSSLIAKKCDGAIMVLVPEENNTRVINRCVKQLTASGVKMLGVVLNKVQYKKNDYYGKYYGSYYGKYYGNDEGK